VQPVVSLTSISLQDISGNIVKAMLFVDEKKTESLDFSLEATGAQHLGFVDVSENTSIELYL
jgi:hypothetical protein